MNNKKTENTTHILWMDGLKGLAAILVFFHHFVGTFYPAYNTGNIADSRLYGIDSFLCNTPAGIIINGNFWVCIFLFISAYVLSIQMLKTEDKDLRTKAGTIMLRRYPRLMIPMFFAGIINYILLFIVTKYDSPYISLRSDMSLIKTIFTYTVSTWIHPNANVFAQLWTMHYLFMTALVVVLFTSFDKKEFTFAPFLYLLMLYPMLIINECYISIVLGIFLADLVYFKRIDLLAKYSKTIIRIIAIIFLLIGIYLGGYPSNTLPVGLYAFLLPLDNKMPFFSGYLHGFAAFFIIASIYLFIKANENGLAKKLLESRVLLLAGKYGLSIYIIHGFFIIYFCPILYFSLANVIKNYNINVLIVLITTICLVSISSLIFNKTVERFTNYVSSKIKLN